MRLDDLVTLGGLLHDIGKPVQRANMYSGDHSKQGAEFLRDLAKNTGRKEFELLSLFSEFHHRDKMNEATIRARIEKLNPRRFGLGVEDILNALWIVYEADNLSSAEREEGTPQPSRPLYSVFNREKAYLWKELDFGNELPVPRDVPSIKGSTYSDLVKKLWAELSRTPLKVDMLLPVLERHLTFVSSVTSEGNVISLYDHMRMTSAIALAMFRAGCGAEDVKAGVCRREKRFLLIEGDFSGIQDFIYGVTGKGTLKYLRARSAYLELIGWDVVLEILSRLGLTRANVIFNAGGHFLIIAQNTPEAVEELEKIRKSVAEWLWEEFEGRLYLAIEWEPITGEELGRKKGENLFAEARKRLKKKLTLRKLRRFGELDEVFEARKSGKLEECAVCRREVSPEELERFKLSEDPEVKVCRTCKELAELGEKLPKIRGFVLDRVAREEEAITHGPFRHFIPYYGGTARGEFLLLKNTLKPPEELPDDIIFVPYFVADYYKPGKIGVATFEELAKASIGTKRLGVLKGDVDKLGEFFGKMDSPSKLATASRFVDYFFKGYLKLIIEGKTGYAIDISRLPSLRDWPEKPDIVVVYAGGDDFFIVGAWDQVFELAFRIRETFMAYTGDGLTLSVGLGYFNPKTPIYRMAETVSERLEVAKEEGRNRVFVIDRNRPDKRHRLSYGWEQYMELWKEYAKRIYAGNGRLKKPFDSKKGLLMTLLQLRDLYVRNPNDVRWAYLIAYLLGRHDISDYFPKLVGISAEAVEKGEPQPVYWVDGVLKVILMAVRR
ncbi:type III-A CRISPR-associated protein Cas10/Csm1 [Pyrococcus yayanosii]|uniref:CRISPR system single-strand-specific deoxyribonuclease Cas10/Csm1 (subtype III-A) n=1 Tax=Pyrococcus yayanosii (strain CH1 / JCM 16557) TaxID=529709 RepID=F8AG53_PYRYC|nr:type III-A CRISPR-associated protein Cas10/Csm1 [Pyrococcus yayanosii]AEH25114.1 CRISPR-associated protein, Csm1 family [Pyrococcus yayanosii CH1]